MKNSLVRLFGSTWPQLVKVGVERGRAQQDVGCNLHATRHYFFKFFKYPWLGDAWE